MPSQHEKVLTLNTTDGLSACCGHYEILRFVAATFP